MNINPRLQDTMRSGEAGISIEEIVKLGAVDTEFFAQTFFPKTYRQSSPTFARNVWNALDNPAYRYINLQMFRGSAKTTRLRTFAAKRIAYRTSRTMLFLSGSEMAAARSIKWIRRQIEVNAAYRDTFGLKPGSKWGETKLEIISTIDGTSTWLLGMGMGANIRGVNFDDYRPDTIVCDDVLTDENVITHESREKTTELLLGAVAGSLISAMEEPNAKLALLQTPLHREDASMMATRHELWHTERYPCWTEETLDLPAEEQESAWPVLFPSETLRAEKRAYAAQGKSHIFMREYEVRLVSQDTAIFKPELLQKYVDPIASRGTTVLSIDPVPPPSDVGKKKKKGDFEALTVWTRAGGNYYLRHYEQIRGHTPAWTVNKTFELARRFAVSYVAVEVVAYQATLKWLLETEMSRRGIYYALIPVTTGRKSKYQRIVDTLGSLLPYRKIFVQDVHTDFINDLSSYPNVEHDDLLDACSIALRALVNPSVELGETEYAEIDESDYEDITPRLRCP